MFFDDFQKSCFFVFQNCFPCCVPNGLRKASKKHIFFKQKVFQKNIDFWVEKSSNFHQKSKQIHSQNHVPQKSGKIAFSDDFGRPNWHFFWHFFEIFCMLKLERILEGKKMLKKWPKSELGRPRRHIWRSPGSAGGDNEGDSDSDLGALSSTLRTT